MASFPDDVIPIPSIPVASHDASKLPAVLVSGGIFLSASALALIVSKTPAGAVLVTWHGSAAAYAYYTVLIVTVAFGLAEASFGFWVVSSNRQRWSLPAKILLSVSMLPLAVVLALWAGLKLCLALSATSFNSGLACAPDGPEIPPWLSVFS